MATYNGAAFLPAQLASFSDQSHRNWTLVASDDHSVDATPELLADFAKQMDPRENPVHCLIGPGQGAAQNFLSLLRAEAAREAAWIAFADQDDVWFPDRLTRGLAALEDISGPALYCSRTHILDGVSQQGRLSAPRPRPPSFRNALVQNIASGNTILLNPAAAALVKAAAHEAKDVVVHDWWTYQLVAGAGGQIIHDDEPTLYYRQHQGNHIGANDTTLARLRRIRQLLRGDLKLWNAVNIEALSRSSHRLTPENQAILRAFADMRGKTFFARLAALRNLHLYRQHLPSTAALWVAAAIGRI